LAGGDVHRIVREGLSKRFQQAAKETGLDDIITHSIDAAQGDHSSALTAIALVVAVAAILGLGFMRLRQPPLVGFIVAGVALGPTGIGLISNNESVSLLAEIGVVVLLFFIGMELSIKAFILTLRQALTVAGGQVGAAMVAGGFIALVSGGRIEEAVIMGFVIATSSTVVAMKMLEDMGVLRGDAGRIAVGVLIAQDIAVVPMLIFVSSLSGESGGIADVAFKMVVAVALLAGILWWFGGHKKIRVPFADQIAEKTELLALGALAVCFAAAAASGLAGLSPVYGAFLAGIITGNSTLRSRIIPVIEPIQSVLVVVFFLSIGLLIDLGFIRAHLWEVLASSIIVIAAKSVLNIFLIRKTGSSAETALIAGLSMAQIGEFSFVLASAGYATGGLSSDLYRLSIAVTAVTLLVSPVWVGMMHRLESVASHGIETYRDALAAAYAQELHEMHRGTAAFSKLSHGAHVRYRAFRLALYHRKAIRRRQAETPAED
jgi:monovalent cation:H+ antiporter-2, CPA2 family